VDSLESLCEQSCAAFEQLHADPVEQEPCTTVEDGLNDLHQRQRISSGNPEEDHQQNRIDRSPVKSRYENTPRSIRKAFAFGEIASSSPVCQDQY
jgi:hypothetical protein